MILFPSFPPLGLDLYFSFSVYTFRHKSSTLKDSPCFYPYWFILTLTSLFMDLQKERRITTFSLGVISISRFFRQRRCVCPVRKFRLSSHLFLPILYVHSFCLLYIVISVYSRLLSINFPNKCPRQMTFTNLDMTLRDDSETF